MKKVFCFFAAVLVAAGAPCTALAARRESTTYAFVGNTEIYTTYVDRTKGNITTVCPDYFEIDSAGNLKLTNKVSHTFVENMRARGVRVTPFLSNHWDMANARAGLNNRATLAGQLAAAVRNYRFDGVDVDIENINQNDRAAFTDFIRLLRAELGPDKTISVCVAANPWGVEIGWQGAYDYRALSPYIDHIFIMAYDEHYSGGSAGPVASYGFARKSVEFALKTLPPEKVMLGIPFYGRYWKDWNPKGGAALTVADIEGLASRSECNSWYDETNECARAILNITEADVAAGLWGGKKLTAGVYDIWYENDRSLKKKLSLVSEFNLKGAGSWAIGQEPARIWNSYRSWLYGLPFTDIYGHWAEQHIVKLFDAGIVSGSSGAFRPGHSMTRAEALKIVAGMVGLEAWAAPSAFRDIEGHWAKDLINTAASRGLVVGSGNGLYRPDVPITRAEFSVLLMRVLQLPTSMDFNEQHYLDVSPELLPWANSAIVALRIHDVLSASPDGRFYPHRNVTRAEASKMAAVALELPHWLPERSRARGGTPDGGWVVEPR